MFCIACICELPQGITMFMWTTIVNSLSQVADHPMSSPCWVDRAGPVLAYGIMHLNDVAPAFSPMISLLCFIKGQRPKTGAPGRFLARNGWAEVRKKKTLNLGSRDWPTPPSTRFWPYTDRDLPILATLVSSHPVLATFCCILLLFTSLFDLTSLA